jgi:hypothetical protein
MPDITKTDLIPIAHVAQSLRVGLRKAREISRQARALSQEGVDCVLLLAVLGLPDTCLSRIRAGEPILLTSPEVARRMGLSPRTVQSYAAGFRPPDLFPVEIPLVAHRRLFLADDLSAAEFHVPGIECVPTDVAPGADAQMPAICQPSAEGCSSLLEDLEGLFPAAPRAKRVRKK